MDLCNNCFNDRTTVRAGFSRAGSSSSTTAFDYDEIGRLTKATYPAIGGLASAKEWRWNDEARTVTRIDEEGRSLIEQYDQLGRFVELRRPAAPPNMAETAAAKVGFNSLGNVAYEEDGAGRRTSYEYDGFGRRIKTVYPDGNFGTTSSEVCRSDPSGAVSVETLTDALGRYTITYLDAAGRKVRVEQEAENGLSAVTRFEYDLLGRITRMVDPAGQETLYSYSTQTPSGTGQNRRSLHSRLRQVPSQDSAGRSKPRSDLLPAHRHAGVHKGGYGLRRPGRRKVRL